MTESIGRARDIEVGARLDILDLYARQSHAVDSGNGDAWADTYTQDGVFQSPTYQLTARGHAELSAFARTSNDAALARGEQFRHLITGIALTPAGPDRIDAMAYLTILATTKEGSRVDRVLVLHDVLRRVGDEWLFASREVFRD